ncbi:MAG TPA: UvrD-helicase domain-containing protein [Solirubrobacteraceae bacterium]|jgi:ATP-dependent exoDNAse (exonuclease V) beta subunit
MEQLSLIEPEEQGGLVALSPAREGAAAKERGRGSVDVPESPAIARVLADEQERAVARRSESLLLAAGAGSGKTTVLVERFVRAVREDGVAPARILAITFTERAAGELRERVRERFLELGAREAARDTEAAFVSTFHGFCARLLRAHSLAAGLDPDFAILDEPLAARLRGQAFGAALRVLLAGERSEAVDLLGAYGADRVRSMVLGVYAELRSRGQRLPALPTPRLPAPTLPLPEFEALNVDAARACALLGELLDAFGRSYEALKRRRAAVDFDDLELGARALLDERADVRATWGERFELLMVDEFQDTNPRQLAILTVLERANLFTVGDELQSIYGFRHAEVEIFQARRTQLGELGASLELTRNFRSRAPLLDVVNAVFAKRFGERHTPLVAGREDDRAIGAPDAHTVSGGDTWVAGGGGDADPLGEPLVELLLTGRRGWDEEEWVAREPAEELPPAPAWRQAEARMLARRVAELVASGAARAGEVAVLLRAVGDLPVYEAALQARGLRTLASVGGFWGRQQVGDLLAYLRALANPLDELALFSTLASPLVGVSSDGLGLLSREAKANEQGVWETIQRVGDLSLPAGDRDALVAFRERFSGERRAAYGRTISQLIELEIEASGYREHVLSLEWGERRLANVHKLLRMARRYEASEGRDLRGFLDHVAHQQDASGGLAAAEADAPVADVEPDAVRLLSIHAAKGLEFAVVCVADLGRAQNLSVPDLLVDDDRIGVRLVKLDGAPATPALDFDELCEGRQQAQAQEEERILYVAMTRARERLLLSGAVDLERWPQERRGAPPIAWLGPALAPDLPARVSSEQRQGETVVDLRVGALATVVRCRVNTPESMAASAAGAPSVPTDRARAGASKAVRVEASRDPTGPARSDGPSKRIDALSYTALGELERCGYRYYLERVLRMPENRAAARAERRREGLEGRARGTLVHRLLESVAFGRQVGPSSADVARVARELNMRVGESEREEIAELLRMATTSELGVRLAASEEVRREHPFAFSLGTDEPLITGVIDVLARERDGLLVVDYKSDRVGEHEDLKALVEREYGAQQLLYALAVLRDGAPDVEVIHWFLHRPQDWVRVRYDVTDRPGLEERLMALTRRARGKAFSVSEDPHRALCETCPGRGGLCSWSEQETMRETFPA